MNVINREQLVVVKCVVSHDPWRLSLYAHLSYIKIANFILVRAKIYDDKKLFQLKQIPIFEMSSCVLDCVT